MSWPDIGHIDDRSAATFRVGVASGLLLQIVSSWPDRCDFYALDSSECGFATGLFALHGLAALFLLVGCWPAACAGVGFALQLALVRLSPATQTGDALLLCSCLLWAALLPNIGARWAVMAGGAADNASRVPAYGLKAQIVLFYLTSVLHKLREGREPSATTDGASTSPWLEGTAVAEALTCCEYATPLGQLLLRHLACCRLLTWGTLAVEAAAPIGLLWFDSVERLVPCLLLVSLHAGLHWAMELGIFSIVCVAALSCFVPADAWALLDDLLKELSSALALPHPRQSAPAAARPATPTADADADAAATDAPTRWRERARTWLAAVLLVCVAAAVAADSLDRGSLAFGTTAGQRGRTGMGSGLTHLANIGRALGLPSRADMFAPPPSECGWWVLAAVLHDGERADAHRLRHYPQLPRAPPSYARPAWPASQHRTLLWHRLFETLSATARWDDPEVTALREQVALNYCARLPSLRQVRARAARTHPNYCTRSHYCTHPQLLHAPREWTAARGHTLATLTLPEASWKTLPGDIDMT